jgi:hypothetical protein
VAKSLGLPLEAGKVPIRTTAEKYRTPMGTGRLMAPKGMKAMRSPMDFERVRSQKGRGQAMSKEYVPMERPALSAAAASSPASSGSMELASLDQTGQVALNLILDTAWEIAGAGDFDGNGTTDILWRYYGSGTYQGWNVIWYMDGTTVIGQGLPNVVYDTNWRIDGTGDFNGDGKADILWRSYSTDAYQGWNIVWYMNGAEILGQGFPNAITDTEWKLDGIGDFDGNGSTDILWRNYGSGAYQGWNIIWYMDGMTITGQGFPNRITDTNWRADGTGDFDNDGKADIIWRCYGTDFYQGWNIIWYMNGAEIKSQEIMKSITDTNWRIANR